MSVNREYVIECSKHGNYGADFPDEECPACSDEENVMNEADWIDDDYCRQMYPCILCGTEWPDQLSADSCPCRDN